MLYILLVDFVKSDIQIDGQGEVAHAAGGLIGALLIFSIIALISLIKSAYYNLTKDRIDSEALKCSYLESKYSITDNQFQKLKAHISSDRPDHLILKSENPNVIGVRPKKLKDNWVVCLITEENYKEGFLIKSNKTKQYVFIVCEINDYELSAMFHNENDKVSLSELYDVLKDQHPEVILPD